MRPATDHRWLCVLIIAAGAAVCPAQDTLWLRRFDFGANAQAVGVDCRDGVIAVAGSVTDSLTLGSDVLAMRCNARGETLWTRRFDTGVEDAAIEACIDADGSILVSGYGMSFGTWSHQGWPLRLRQREIRTVMSEQESLRSITVKYDSGGNLKWTRIASNLISFGMALDTQGNCYVSGASGFQTGVTDLWLAKLNPQGETLWTRTYDVSPVDMGYRLALCPDGNIAVAGLAGDGMVNDILTAKFTPDGDTLWLRQHSSPEGGLGIGVAVDRQGNVISCGWTNGPDSEHIAVLKHDSAGNEVWSRLYAPGAYSESYDVACDSTGSIFVAGSTGQFFWEQYLVMKLTPDGDEEWSAIYDGDGADYCQAVVCDELANPITGGASEDANSQYDVLLAKYVGAVGLAEHSRQRITGGELGLRRGSFIGNSIVMYAPTTGVYRVDLRDAAGRRLATLHQGWLSIGPHRLNLPRPPGIGFLSVTGPGVSATCKIVAVE